MACNIRKIIPLSDSDESDNENQKNNDKQSSNVRENFSSRLVKKYRERLKNYDKELEELFEKIDCNKSNDDSEIFLIELSNDSQEIICLDDQNDKNINGIKTKNENRKRKSPVQKQEIPKKTITIEDQTHNKEQNTDDDNSIVKEEKIQEFINNKPMKIMIKRLDRIERFLLKRDSPLSSILDEISDRFNVPVTKIILYLNDNIVHDLSKSTPNSLNLSVADILELLVRYDGNENETQQPSGSSTTNKNQHKNDPDFLAIHLQDNSKKRLTCFINKYELVRKLAEFYSENKNIPIDRIQLQFDCEPMLMEEKIYLYHVENDELIDVIIS